MKPRTIDGWSFPEWESHLYGKTETLFFSDLTAKAAQRNCFVIAEARQMGRAGNFRSRLFPGQRP